MLLEQHFGARQLEQQVQFELGQFELGQFELGQFGLGQLLEQRFVVE